ASRRARSSGSGSRGTRTVAARVGFSPSLESTAAELPGAVITSGVTAARRSTTLAGAATATFRDADAALAGAATTARDARGTRPGTVAGAATAGPSAGPSAGA